jgi:hypothetical protein
VIRFGRIGCDEAIMAAKDISVKKYVVRLSGEEREQLQRLLKIGRLLTQARDVERSVN